MIPILFESNETVFTTHGLGDLMDTIEASAEVTEEGEYEMAFKYPITGAMFNELLINRIVLAKANSYDPYQVFRIYSITKPINGVVEVACQHISYDLANMPVKAFKCTTSEKASDAINKMYTNTVNITGMSKSTSGNTKYFGSFVITTDVTRSAQNVDRLFKMEEPSTVRATLLDGDDSIRGTFGGRLVFNNYSVQLLETPGSNRGITINYGIDLIDMEQEENISEMITGVLPYYKYSKTTEKSDGSNETNDYYVYGSIQYATTSSTRHRIQPLDLTEHFPNQKTCQIDGTPAGYHKGDLIPPTAAEVEEKARQWIAKEEIGEPEISLTLSYAQLGQDVRMYDQINVRFPKLGIEKSALVTRYKYDVLNERCVEIDVGKVKDSLTFKLSDASRLKFGLIPPKRINNINGNKISNGSVGGSKLSGGGVSNWHLKDDAVDNDKIADDAVDTDQIKDNAVKEEKINMYAVTTGKLGAGSVTKVKIGDKQVAEIKLVQTVQNAIAAVWTIDELVADWMTTGYLEAYHIYASHKLEVGGDLYVSGTIHN